MHYQNIDFSSNSIQEQGIEEIVKLLKTSIHVVNCDLRKNPGLTIDHSRKIAYRLLKNIKKLKKNEKVS